MGKNLSLSIRRDESMCRDGGEVRKIPCLGETQQDGVFLGDEWPQGQNG